jgi:hypothetical protein
MILGVSGNPAEHHYAEAAVRHYQDGDYLYADGRLPNADYHFGFAVECALKSLLLRFIPDATMAPKRQGKPPAKEPPAKAPWVPDPTTGRPHEYGHLPWDAADVALFTRGRSSVRLTTVLAGLTAFASWSVHHRYLDGTAVVATEVAARRTVAKNILALHQNALITGRLP